MVFGSMRRNASLYLAEQGYGVKDVGATQSYDLDARRAGERLYVEVKGTTTAWTDSSEIILTRNEVELHLREHPNTMLLIVSRIVLDRSTARSLRRRRRAACCG
jgi:hypothetical protein